jgi:DNA-binding CsgD family transcriptional regulator
MQGASLIREGKSSKEITHLLNIEPSAVNDHRRSMRQKLGLKSSSTSLQVYLSNRA